MERMGSYTVFTAKQSSILSTLRMALPFVSTILDKRSSVVRETEAIKALYAYT